MTWYGYTRTASFEADLLRKEQYNILISSGVSSTDITDEIDRDGKNIGQNLVDLANSLRSGDTLAALSLDRLGGDLRQLISIFATIHRNGANFIALQDEGHFNTLGPHRASIVAAFVALEEFDRRMIQGSKRYGAYISNKRGHRGGKGKKMDKEKILAAAHAMSSQGTNVKELCSSLGIARQTLYRFIGPEGELREPALKLIGQDEINQSS